MPSIEGLLPRKRVRKRRGHELVVGGINFMKIPPGPLASTATSGNEELFVDRNQIFIRAFCVGCITGIHRIAFRNRLEEITCS